MKHDPLSHLFHTITHIRNTKHISQFVTTNSGPETTQQTNTTMTYERKEFTYWHEKKSL